MRHFVFGLLCSLLPALALAQPADEPTPVEGAAAPAAAEAPAAAPEAAPPAVEPAAEPAATPAAASGALASTPDRECPKGNLLAAKRPSRRSNAKHTIRLTNDRMARDGSTWNGEHSALLEGSKAFVEFDLGKPTGITALFFQGDNNDTYQVEGSLDRRTWSPIWTVPTHPQTGLQTRLSQGLDHTARYLRLGKAEGDNAYSVGEFQAYCQQPALWPPPVTELDPEDSKSGKITRKMRLAWNKTGIAVLGLVAFLGLFGVRRRWPKPLLTASLAATGSLGVLIFATRVENGSFTSTWVVLSMVMFAVAGGWFLWCAARHRQGQPYAKFVERGVLVALIAASAVSWMNYGTFHGSRVVHYWDSFHYYIGGKYFRENRYHLIYQCSAIAEVDDGRRSEFDDRQIRDLRDNSLGAAEPHLDRDEECRAAFTPERWAAYRQDLRLFRSFMGKSWWGKMFKDHGFNASPVWIMTGNLITNVGWDEGLPPPELANAPSNMRGKNAAQRKEIRERFKLDKDAFESRIQRIAMFDGALYIGIFAFIFWAFGLKATALAMLIWGCGYPWAYFWTGGSFGRVPWLFMSVAGTCFMARGYQMLGGFGITWAMLLRVFPGALIGGVSVKIAWNIIRHRTITVPHRKLILGCTLGLVVLVGASLPVVGGFDAYKEFVGNSFKHKGTPLTNNMGLPTLLSYSPSGTARRTRDNTLDDPFAVWKVKRQETLESRKILHYAMLLLFLGMLGYAGRSLEDWELTALSTILIVGIFELTCYYYNFVVLLAPLALRRMSFVIALFVMTILGQWTQLTVGWYDVQYTWESLYVLLAMLYILGRLVWEQRLRDTGRWPPEGDPDVSVADPTEPNTPASPATA